MAETKLHNYSVQEKLNKMDVDVISITPTTFAGDVDDDAVAFDFTEIPNAVAVPGGSAIIQSITVLDTDAVGGAIDLVFADASTSLGTLDAAITLNDAGSANILGYTSITSYLAGAALWKVASKNNLGMVVKAAAGSTSIYVAAVNRNGGAITQTASGFKLKIGIVKD